MNFPTLQTPDHTAPRIERIRHELRRRAITVVGTQKITPGMLRITFHGDDLADFVSAAPDDHLKIVLPGPDGVIRRRDYTPRWFRPQTRTLAIDFAIHEAGPATHWALEAKPGDVLEIDGPRGSAVLSADIGNWLQVGDETALPAIGRRIEEARAGSRIVSVVAVAGPHEQQRFATAADLTALWAHRPPEAAGDPAALLSVLADVELKPDTFVWIAAEAAVARAIRTYVLEERGQPRSWTKAAGYWVMGKADAHEKFE